VPFYLEWWSFVLLIALWALVPLAAGYWRFSRADLN
jgi:ABC-type transport system involved in multi-copper enzyme maturation permease subunit